MLGDVAESEIEKIALSNNTIRQRTTDLSDYIEKTLQKKLKECSRFALQVDESVDICSRS